MKIFFLTLSSFRQFPTYKRAVGMGEALANLGHDVTIACMDCEENRVRMAAEAPHCQPMWFKGGDPLREAWAKLRMAWKVRPDVIYSPSYSVRNLAGLRMLLPWGCRYCLEFCELYTNFGEAPIMDVLREKLTQIEADCLVCASKYLMDYFSRQSLSKKKPKLYLPYAYPEYLRPCAFDRTGTRVMFMAALYKNYGIYDVLAACKKLVDRGVALKLDVLGGGPEKEWAKAWVTKNGLQEHVIIHGYVPEEDLNGCFSKADVFVSPLHDTVQDVARCPSKIYYYIPYNRPIVTCKIGDPYETLKDYGFYYKPDDIDDMADVIERAMRSSRSFSYSDGFIANHSWAARAQTFIEWIKENPK